MEYSGLPFEDLISVKPNTSYSNEIMKDVYLLTVKKNESKLVGSFTFRVSKNPSDLDIHEDYVECCTKEQVINKFIHQLQLTVSNILRQPNHYFMEFKAGIDNRYVIDVDSPNLISNIDVLFEHNLLTQDDMDIINDLLHTENFGEFEKESLSEFLRLLYTIRWNANEILDGFKILNGGKFLSLKDALLEQSAVNLEIIAYVDGRFIEESNFFELLQKDINGNVHTINSPQESYDDFEHFFIDQVKHSIYKLYYSPIGSNYFKMAKRMWSLAKFIKDEAMIRRLLPLLTSDYGIVNQIKTDIATINKLLEKNYNVPLDLIMEELSKMKGRLSNVLILSNEFLLEFNNTIDNTMTLNIPELIIENLKPMEKKLKNIVNIAALTFLENNNLAPPPENYIP
jgi:hypothetical protein